jgi:hypothetical protein
MNNEIKSIAIKALKTFVQAFLAGWALTQFDFSKGALVGAFAAGFSAIMNIGIGVYDSRKQA